MCYKNRTKLLAIYMARNSLRQRFFEQLTKAFPLGVTAGTRYTEKQLAGLGI